MIVCALHPGEVDNNNCVDYRFDVDLNFDTELWTPEGCKFLYKFEKISTLAISIFLC